jgi:hypothetical protein
MEFKGTKGKWKLIIPKHNESNGFASISTEDGSITCYNGSTGESYGGAHLKSLANALLISKAPEMLEFLETIVCSGNTPIIHRKRAEQLIKEATELN